MDDMTPATEWKPPFWPIFRYNRGAVPPMRNYQSFLEDHRWYYGSTTKTDKAIVASTSDATFSCHRGSPEHRDCRSWLGQQWSLPRSSNPLLTKITRTEKRPSPDILVTSHKRIRDHSAMELP
ncbi:hypothetical protein MRX96_015045 [Rhipicephalus microplus]